MCVYVFHVSASLCVRVCVFAFASMCIRVYMCMCVYVYVYVCASVCMCVYIHTNPILCRLMESFARRYVDNNPDSDLFPHTDTCYLLAFATIMLNTGVYVFVCL